MQQYLDLVSDVLGTGNYKQNRTGVPTYSVFGRQLRFNLQDGFPLLTTRRIFFKAVVAELLWFLSGDTNVKALQSQGIHIWDEWADENGELGPVYGAQWTHWQPGDINQIQNTVDLLKTDPNSRRIVVDAWNVGYLPRMSLPPCHFAFQFYTRGIYLDCHFIMRSTDVVLGLPFNIASYALLTCMMAQVTGYLPGELIWTGGDVHVYTNHSQGLREQLTRPPRLLPRISLNKHVTDIFAFKIDDILLTDYYPHAHIKFPIAV